MRTSSLAEGTREGVGKEIKEGWRAPRGATAAPSAKRAFANAPSTSTYTAALADTVRKVKILSLSSLAATAIGCPLFLELSSPELALEAKAAVSATVIGFGTFTTVLLQWFVSPYVKTLVVDRGVVRATKFAWNARTYESTFAKEDMIESESSRPLVSWEAKGKHYYVEMQGVPKEIYNELDLARFDSQAKAEAAAKNMMDEED